MRDIGELKSRVLELVAKAPERRIRPIDLERAILGEGGSSKTALKQALNALVQAEKLVYTYRDPCSFLELPALESQSTK
jgi:hypothetical protein